MTRHIERWKTTAATALPAGWRNVYRRPDTGTLETEPCPALLTQEHRQTVTHDAPALKPVTPDRGPVRDEARTITTHHEPPYDIRVVFASHIAGVLHPALYTTNYLGTVGPGEDPDIYRDDTRGGDS